MAGFAEEDIEVECKESVLNVSGKRQDEGGGRTYLHQGIAARTFQRSFQLEEHIEVLDGHLSNGLLQINLVRRLPDAMKPRRIKIKGEPSRLVESSKAA